MNKYKLKIVFNNLIDILVILYVKNNKKMLSLLLLLPIIGSILLSTIPENSIENKIRMKRITLITMLINFLISIYIWLEFDSNTSQYQFVYEFIDLNYCHLNIGIDGISLYFVLLTTFISPIAILSNYNNINNNLKYFLISFLLLETLQIGVFVVLDLILFYIFFESVLPILFLIIIIYGSGEARIRSALLLFLYTLAGSLFMLLAILQIYSFVGSTDFQIISLSEINLNSQKILWLGFFIAFAVKTPLWPLTGWLYRAHADSPLAGSILLAATILKFATYGYLRVLINFLPDATNYFSPLVQTIAIITLIYASLATIIQQDTKALIAYSSIAHMSIVILGLFSNTIQGIEGAILLALAHGFVSPALFICVGGVIYDRTGTRIIHYVRGLVTYMPVFTILFFIFTLSNTGIPLTLNFLGEQLSLIGIWERSPLIAVLGATGIVLSAIYSIYLYNRISYGIYSPHLKPIKDISRREFNLLITLLLPTMLLGIFPNVILDGLHFSISSLLYNI
jgi:NADH-ubiquinone oxidoreductase chain 4